MKYFAQERPNLSGTDEPLLLDSNCVLPGFYIDAENEHTVRVTVWLPSADNAFSSKAIFLARCQLEPFIADYMADPEKVLKEEFEWTPVKQLRSVAEALTLEDLEL